MICVSEFLTTLFRHILEKPIAANRYVFKYNISRNNFAYYINTNRPMSSAVANGLYRIVLDTIKEHPEKEKNIIDYLSSFLAVKEKDLLSDCEIIRAAIAKFTASTSKKKNRIRAVTYQETIALNLNIKELVREAMHLNNETMQGLTAEHGGQLEQWTPIARECFETWRYIFDQSNKMIGLWAFYPVFDDIFKQIKDGLFFDEELTIDMIPVLLPGAYNIYFVEICMTEKYKGTTIFRLLLKSIAQVLEHLAYKEIFINEICTQAYTTDGERLCKSLGLKYHKSHIDCGNIYCGTIKDLLKKPFCRNFYTLKRLYSSK
jgi:hypothetical protein